MDVKMKCTACGKELNSGSKFCNYCGVPVTSLDNTNPSIKSENTTPEDYRIELVDENGNSVYFEFLDLIAYGEAEYVVLFPEEDDEEKVVILQIEAQSDGSESYVAIEDDELLETLFEIFKEKNQDYFNFID